MAAKRFARPWVFGVYLVCLPRFVIIGSTVKELGMNNKATKIANAFSAILREWLSAEEMAELNERNRGYIEANSPMCDSHDYCDPNQAMIEAY